MLPSGENLAIQFFNIKEILYILKDKKICGRKKYNKQNWQNFITNIEQIWVLLAKKVCNGKLSFATNLGKIRQLLATKCYNQAKFIIYLVKNLGNIWQQNFTPKMICYKMQVCKSGCFCRQHFIIFENFWPNPKSGQHLFTSGNKML